MDEPQQQPGRSYRHRYEGPFFRRLFLLGVRFMPYPLQRVSMPLWAGIFHTLVPGARHVIEDNLDRVMGPAPPWLRRLRSYRLFVNYAQTLTDSYSIHLGQVPMTPVSQGRSHLLGALARGKGVIALTGHLGIWQFGPFLAEWRDLPTFHMAMAEEPNPMVQQFEQQFRSRFRVIYTTGSPFSSLELVSVLRRGLIVGMQLDRHTGGETVPVEFFGRTAWFAAGPAILSRLTGAPLVPLFFVIEPDPLAPRRRVAHHVEEAIEVAHTADRQADIVTATQKVARVYERFVRRYPEQWYNFHDLWAPPAPGGQDAPRRDRSRTPGRVVDKA